MNARELALIDARSARLIAEIADLRGLLRDVADYSCEVASGGIGTRCGQMLAWLKERHGPARTDTGARA